MRKILIALALMLAPLPAAAQVQTTLNPSLPALPQADQGPNDPDAIYCRPPQQLPDSRFMGPRVCMTNRKWDVLRSQGLEITADGRNTVTCRRASVGTDVVCNKGRSLTRESNEKRYADGGE